MTTKACPLFCIEVNDLLPLLERPDGHTKYFITGFEPQPLRVKEQMKDGSIREYRKGIFLCSKTKPETPSTQVISGAIEAWGAKEAPVYCSLRHPSGGLWGLTKSGLEILGVSKFRSEGAFDWDGMTFSW